MQKKILVLFCLISLLGGIATAAPWAQGSGGCREHWTQYVETAGANVHLMPAAGSGQLTHQESDFTKTSSSTGFGNCWEWDPNLFKTGLKYDTSNAGCTFTTSPVRIRFEYAVDGFVNATDAVMTSFLGHNAGAAGELDLGDKLLGSSDQSTATSINLFGAGIFQGIGNEAAWEGEVSNGDRITLGASGSTGIFSLTTDGSTLMRIETLTCAAS